MTKYDFLRADNLLNYLVVNELQKLNSFKTVIPKKISMPPKMTEKRIKTIT